MAASLSSRRTTNVSTRPSGCWSSVKNCQATVGNALLGVDRLPPSLFSSKNLVQTFLPLLDQPLGGRDDFFGQEFEQVVLIGEADGLQHTLLYEEVLKHRPALTFLLKDRDKGDLTQVHGCGDFSCSSFSNTIPARARAVSILIGGS
jgi:hypothetical protein